MTWEEVRQEFAWDGSLRDIFVLDTDESDYQRLLDFLLNSPYGLRFSVDGEMAPVPPRVSEILARQEHGYVAFCIDISVITLCWNFYATEEIELDIDPRKITCERRFHRLLDFLQNIARTLQKPVRLTPEGCQDIVILSYSSQEDEWQYTPFGGWT